jgi:ribosomal protein L37AE/L43A
VGDRRRVCPVCKRWLVGVRRGPQYVWLCDGCHRIWSEAEYWERVALEAETGDYWG